MSDSVAQKDGDKDRIFPDLWDTDPLSEILKTGGGQSHNNMPPYVQISYWIYMPPNW